MWTLLRRRHGVLLATLATALLFMTTGGIAAAGAPSGDDASKLPVSAAEIAALSQERGKPIFLFFQTPG